MIQRLPERDPTTVRDRIVDVVGSGAVALERSVPLAAPSTEEETSALMRVAGEEGWRVLPRGAGLDPHTFGVGEPDSGGGWSSGRHPELILSSSGMTELIDHEPGDFNVRVGAGLSLGALQAKTEAEGQWLALDPPGGLAVTVGGIVSTGVAGPLRAQYGRPRDHLLGLTLVDGKGRILRLGGRVVKNVAGFDLVRLAAGSRGALGVITQITFRLHPQPEEDCTLIWSRADLASAWELGRDLATLPIPLAAAELVAGSWPSPLDGDSARVLLRVTGSRMAVQRTTRLLVERGGAPDEELMGESSVAASLAMSTGDRAGAKPFRLHALPSLGGDLLGSLAALPCERLAFHLLGGTCRGALCEEATPDVVSAMAAVADRLGGTLSVAKSPEATQTNHAAVEGSPPKVRLRGEIIRGFDPSGVLPGAWRDGWLGSEGEG